VLQSIKQQQQHKIGIDIQKNKKQQQQPATDRDQFQN
jgi:hypothetical protein